LLLIRTGSKEHNIKLCQQAKRRGMKLHADGSGLEKMLAGQGHEIDNSTTSRIPCPTEQSIFEALGLVYAEPWEREV
jgi:DNA polymerase/3'-5' exonuclease PolX